MIPQRRFQTICLVVFVIAAMGVYLTFAVPLLKFADAGAMNQIPTQIFVVLLRILVSVSVFGVLGMGMYFTYQFNLVGILGMLVMSIFLLALGVAIKQGMPLFILTVTIFIPFWSVGLGRLRPAILSLQRRYERVRQGAIQLATDREH